MPSAHDYDHTFTKECSSAVEVNSGQTCNECLKETME